MTAMVMFPGTSWQGGGACFVGRNVIISSGRGATGGEDDNNTDVVSHLYLWWLVLLVQWCDGHQRSDPLVHRPQRPL